MTDAISWSPQQDAALKTVSRWLKEPGGPQVFRLFGYAGTGKTTLARYFAGEISGTVLYGAFTGKAASVMRQKGCATLALYRPDPCRRTDHDREERSMKSDLVDIRVILHHETERAVKVSDDGDEKNAVWLPKSKIEIARDGGCWEVTLPEWLAIEKGLV